MEIVSPPEVYGFDTGFVCHHRGWDTLRREDLGVLREHPVLHERHAHPGASGIHYRRSKPASEVDFVLAGRGAPPVAIECQWSAADFDPAALKAFRGRYPRGPNVLVASDVTERATRRHGSLAVRHVSLPGLMEALRRLGRRPRPRNARAD